MTRSCTMAVFFAFLCAPLNAQDAGMTAKRALVFELVQPDLFGAGRSLTNAIADFDNDGDLDIFVGFNAQPNRLYRNEDGVFSDVAASVGLDDTDVTRTAAWGDYNGDGHLDLFVGFVSREGSSNKLYRNDGNGEHFTDVTEETGAGLSGSFRQASWIDYDGDSDLDLYIGLRDKPNVLLENNSGLFSNIAPEKGVADARRTVGAAWFDYDQDGDLDLVVANMDGDGNGLFRNDGDSFVDVAAHAGLIDGGRGLGDESLGTVRPTIVDYDNDGHLDVFMANYGPNGLFRNNGDGTFDNKAPALGLAIDNRYDTSTWGDFDNDGLVDVYINGTITGGVSYRDYIFRNTGHEFVEVTPEIVLDQKGDHGAHWVDFNQDGALDLALTGAAEDGMHHLLRNMQNAGDGANSLTISVRDSDGHQSLAGSEVRLYDSISGDPLGTRILDTGSGYNSQNAMPVHFGLGKVRMVDVEVTFLATPGRLQFRETKIDPSEYSGRILAFKVSENGLFKSE